MDEIGSLPISRTGAMLFFQLMSRGGYEPASTVLNSNKGFEEWGEIFGGDVMASALIDWLVHHCHIVNIRGNSYRMRQHADGGAPRFLDSVDLRLLWSCCTGEARQEAERSLIPEG